MRHAPFPPPDAARRHTPVPLVRTEEVADALAEGAPVVALESNVITHGLAYPDNVETALRVEAAVRAGGAVPATIGVEDGRFLIGLTGDQIERFATAANVPKTSSRDLPIVLARGGLGATSVASSLVAAELAGIPFFSSAGIGGVHRGAATSFDVSSDLIQFTRSKVAVVCAGAKNILDLGLTLEVLETQCVPVISWRFDDFPAFYCRSSGFRSPHRLDEADAVARAIELHWALGNHSAVLITAPTREEDALDGAALDAVVDAAQAAAEAAGVRGAALTKYVMHAVDAATHGRSSRANTAVLVNTAEIAGRLAAAHARHCAQDASSFAAPSFASETQP